MLSPLFFIVLCRAVVPYFPFTFSMFPMGDFQDDILPKSFSKYQTKAFEHAYQQANVNKSIIFFTSSQVTSIGLSDGTTLLIGLG